MTKFAVATLWLLGGLSLAAIGAAASVGDATPPTTRLVPVWQLAYSVPGLGSHELDLDNMSEPHLLFTRTRPERLSYAHRTDDGWHTFDVAPVTFSPDFSFDLAVPGPIGSDAGPVVAYTDLARDALFVLTAEPDLWTWQQVNDGGRLVTLFADEPMMVSVHGPMLAWWIDGETLAIASPVPYIWNLMAAAGRRPSADDVFMVVYVGATGSHLVTLNPDTQGWIDATLPFENVVALALSEDGRPLVLVTDAEVIDPGHPPSSLIRLSMAEWVDAGWQSIPIAEGLNWTVEAQLVSMGDDVFIAYRDPDGYPILRQRDEHGTWRVERLDAQTVGDVSLAVTAAGHVFLAQSDGETLQVWERQLRDLAHTTYMPLSLSVVE